ncbi:MAG: hypothetical protein WC694_03620 [Candidatus Paceibacterota bacterium]|jgi:hypothetical protein
MRTPANSTFDCSELTKSIVFKNDTLAGQLNFETFNIKFDSTHANQTILKNWIQNLDSKEKEKLKQFGENLSDDLQGIESQKSLVFSIKVEMKYNHQVMIQEILNYYSLLITDKKISLVYKQYNQWVKSEAHALFLYNELTKNHFLERKELLRYLVYSNKFFKNIDSLESDPTSFLTYAFEKEGNKSEISYWYKEMGYTDDEWQKLSDRKRMSLLDDLRIEFGTKKAHEHITTTTFGPHYLGGYDIEYDGGSTWEIKNKLYEIHFNRLMNQIREVVTTFKETHSIHTHIVFEMPVHYPYFKKFQTWTKHVNDYLYLSGLEEGLHTNEVVALAQFPEDVIEHFDKFKATPKTLPDELSQVREESHKFLTMGIRAHIYGNSPHENRTRIGLELRDSTRNIEKLENFMLSIKTSVKKYAWEYWTDHLIRDNFTFLRPDLLLYEKHLKKVLSPKLYDLIVAGDDNVSLVLQHFEEGVYFDFKKGVTLKPNAKERLRIMNARDIFISELKKIDTSLKTMDEKGESYYDIDVEYAIKSTITDWAKMARVSELFSNF